MAKGYWVARIDVHDLDGYKRDYVAHNGAVFKKYGAKFLVRRAFMRLVGAAAHQKLRGVQEIRREVSGARRHPRGA